MRSRGRWRSSQRFVVLPQDQIVADGAIARLRDRDVQEFITMPMTGG